VLSSAPPARISGHARGPGPSPPSQEMFEEYTTHLMRPGTPSKTFRIRVFVFAAAEEPYAPDQEMDEQIRLDGERFFG